MNNNDSYIVTSLSKPNTYYIFRDNNVEVEVEIINGKLISSFTLFDEEIEYFKNKKINLN